MLIFIYAGMNLIFKFQMLARKFFIHESFNPRGRPQSRPVVITIFTQSVRPSVHPSQTLKQGLWAGRVDH